MVAIYHPNVVSIVPHYNIGSGRDAVNVTHWGYVGDPLTGTALTAIQTAFDAAWYGQWKNWAGSGVYYLGAWVIDNSSATGGQRTNAAYVPAGGLGGSQAAGDQMAGLISIHGYVRYRGGHSRLYIPGASASMLANDGQNWTPTGTGYLGTMWNNTVAAMAAVSEAEGGPITPLIWHKKWSAAPNTLEAVASITVQALSATQRRRVRKVSRHRSVRAG